MYNWYSLTPCVRPLQIDSHHLALQANAKRRAGQEAAHQKQVEELAQAKLDAELQRRRADAELSRKHMSARVAEQIKQQMTEKEKKDEAMREVYSNRVTAEYFAQFGTSHRWLIGVLHYFPNNCNIIFTIDMKLPC